MTTNRATFSKARSPNAPPKIIAAPMTPQTIHTAVSHRGSLDLEVEVACLSPTKYTALTVNQTGRAFARRSQLVLAEAAPFVLEQPKGLGSRINTMLKPTKAPETPELPSWLQCPALTRPDDNGISFWAKRAQTQKPNITRLPLKTIRNYSWNS